MTNPTKNLKAVIEYFGVSKNQMARALGVNPSLVSRWLSGERRLRAASPQMDAITEYILARSKRVHDMEWLKAQFEAAGLPTDISSVYRTRQNLIMWLASDGEDLRRNLGGSPQTAAAKNPPQKKSRIVPCSGDSAVRLGCLDIVLELQPILSGLPCKSVLNIFLSSDQITTTINEDVAALLLCMMGKSDLKFRMVVCVSGIFEFIQIIQGGKIMFVWIGKKGFMRGPVWFLFFLGCIAIAFTDIMAITGQFEPPDLAPFILVSVLAVLYIIAYIIASKRLKPLWERKRPEVIQNQVSKKKK